MIKSAVTISLVPEARGGPFVFWHDLEDACRVAARLGFDGIEIFPPGPEAIARDRIKPLLDRYQLRLAAVGTGAGWLKHGLTLTNADAAVRNRARAFIASMVEAAGALGAPVIVGSMQGRWAEPVMRNPAVFELENAFSELVEKAREVGMPLLYEPLNRYETNLVNSVKEAAELLRSYWHLDNLKLLADLFHMNIEEADMAASIRAAGKLIGHVHFADSNRRPAGMGHTDFAPVVAALRDIGYEGYVSAECLPGPDPDEAARQTIESFRKLFR